MGHIIINCVTQIKSVFIIKKFKNFAGLIWTLDIKSNGTE